MKFIKKVNNLESSLNIIKKIKIIIRGLKYRVKDLFYKDYIKLSWDQGTNFGDAINPILIEKIFNKKVCWVHHLYYPKTYLMGIGSILQKANSNAIIWGTGFISNDCVLKEKPKKIYAVRGPKTRQRLLELGIECPEVYGDPALLLPLIYKPTIQKKYKLGIIPHYVDKQSPILDKFKNNAEILIIDIKNKEHFEFIDLLLSCEKVASSSLHGIIVADAYQIPSIWIELSNNVKGNGFKFLDYFASVKRKEELPFILNDKITEKMIYNQFCEYKIDINLSKLMNSSPYKIKLKSFESI
jgi:pyruvyltransferase